MVFGASGGIGSALSKRLLAQPGSTVFLAGRDEAKLQQLQSSLGGGVPLVGDPLDPKQVSQIVLPHWSSCNALTGTGLPVMLNFNSRHHGKGLRSWHPACLTIASAKQTEAAPIVLG